MIRDALLRRHLPDLFTMCDGTTITNPSLWPVRRAQLLEILSREIYGMEPPAPLSIRAEILETEPELFAGKATLTKVCLHATLPQGVFAFPLYTVIPNAPGPHPAFIHINFRDHIPDLYMPSEEICDNGFAAISFCYQDVTRDDRDFTSGLAGLLYGENSRNDTDPGKISMWAWAVSRALDYALSLPQIDAGRMAVIGHSRLGKTALLAAARDPRFSCAISNNSGCSGAALTRQKAGERVADIVERFPYWFCRRYAQYAGHEEGMPFDQHFLVAAIAPKGVYIASADRDIWADPLSEYLCCTAVDPVYRLLGYAGFCHPDRLPQVGDVLHQGRIAYHLRAGTHDLSREDWQRFMQYLAHDDKN